MTRHETIAGSRQLHHMRLIFGDDGTIDQNQIQMRRYSCICDSCRVGEECIHEWEVNRWQTKRLELRRQFILPDNFIDDDFVPL